MVTAAVPVRALSPFAVFKKRNLSLPALPRFAGDDRLELCELRSTESLQRPMEARPSWMIYTKESLNGRSNRTTG